VTYKVLIVDDSSFFQTRLKGIVNEHPELEVIGIAANGQEAIDKDEQLKPDVISMDYEMPFVDGVTAVRTILSKRSVPIIMFSSMTYDGARITLDALDAGAVDFMPKNFAEVSGNSASMKKRFHEKLITFARNAKPKPRLGSPAVASAGSPSTRAQPIPAASSPARARMPAQKPIKAATKSIKGKIKLLIIGASTGGPVAVSDIITKLPAEFPAPIVIVQHMPENFTRAFAERLNRQSALNVKEADSGDRLAQGQVLVAPGGKQLMFERSGNSVRILPADERINYKPSVDISFGSAAQVFGDSVLSIMLTGMGSDGCEGARLLKQAGAQLWAQNKETCVVYGMPAAVVNADLADHVLPISQFASKLTNEV